MMILYIISRKIIIKGSNNLKGLKGKAIIISIFPNKIRG